MINDNLIFYYVNQKIIIIMMIVKLKNMCIYIYNVIIIF